MKKYHIAVIPGDGIGPEVIDIGLKVLQKIASKSNFCTQISSFPFGADYYCKTGKVLPEASLEELATYDAILLGAVGSPEVKPGILEQGILLKLRFSFDQYINLRPVRLYPGIKTPVRETSIDYVVVRENTGGLYSGVGGRSMEGTEHEIAVQSMVYNYHQVYRCLDYAFNVASKRPRKILALVGKSNVLTHAFPLWERIFRQLGDEKYPHIKREYYHVDAACVHMINDPKRFDVIVTTNMFGDILTDLAAATQGGMGMAASGNLNPTAAYPSMFEPVHGSAPDIVGKNQANPLATILTIKMMLEFFQEEQAALLLDQAINNVTMEGIDNVGTREIGQKIFDHLY